MRDVNRDLLLQLANALWLPAGSDAKEKETRIRAACAAFQDINPSGGTETLLATQVVATHEAAMECLRRAMLVEMSDDGRDQNLKHAERLLAIYTRQPSRWHGADTDTDGGTPPDDTPETGNGATDGGPQVR